MNKAVSWLRRAALSNPLVFPEFNPSGSPPQPPPPARPTSRGMKSERRARTRIGSETKDAEGGRNLSRAHPTKNCNSRRGGHERKRKTERETSNRERTRRKNRELPGWILARDIERERTRQKGEGSQAGSRARSFFVSLYFLFRVFYRGHRPRRVPRCDNRENRGAAWTEVSPRGSRFRYSCTT